MAETNQFGSN